MTRNDIMERRIIEEFEKVNHYNYILVGSTIDQEDNLILLTFEVHTPNVTGTVDIRATVGEQLTMNASYDNTALLDYSEIQMQISEDLVGVCNAINTYYEIDG